MFKKDLRNESLVRRKQSRLLCVLDAKGSKVNNILDHYMILTEVEMHESLHIRTPS